MASRNSRNSRTSRNSARETTSRTTQRVDPQGASQPFAIGAETSSTLLRTAEVWSQFQLQALQRNGEIWRQAAERLRTATGPLELIAAQNQIMMDAWLQFLQLTQDLVRAGAAASPAAAEAADTEASAATASAASTLQAPMLQAWQAMVNPLGWGGAGFLNGEAQRAAH